MDWLVAPQTRWKTGQPNTSLRPVAFSKQASLTALRGYYLFYLLYNFWSESMPCLANVLYGICWRGSISVSWLWRSAIMEPTLPIAAFATARRQRPRGPSDNWRKRRIHQARLGSAKETKYLMSAGFRPEYWRS